MPKYYCDYCDVFLTHDSSSVRKAHNAGRNHLVNVKDYYAALGHDKAQMIIDEIVRVYMRGGPPGPVGSMFPGVLANQGGAGSSSSFSAPPPAPTQPTSFQPPPSFQPPAGMPAPPPGMPMLPSAAGPKGGPPMPMPAPNQSLGLPPINSPANQSGPPADGPKINPQRAAALGLR